MHRMIRHVGAGWRRGTDPQAGKNAKRKHISNKHQIIALEGRLDHLLLHTPGGSDNSEVLTDFVCSATVTTRTDRFAMSIYWGHV